MTFTCCVELYVHLQCPKLTFLSCLLHCKGGFAYTHTPHTLISPFPFLPFSVPHPHLFPCLQSLLHFGDFDSWTGTGWQAAWLACYRLHAFTSCPPVPMPGCSLPANHTTQTTRPGTVVLPPFSFQDTPVPTGSLNHRGYMILTPLPYKWRHAACWARDFLIVSFMPRSGGCHCRCG